MLIKNKVYTFAEKNKRYMARTKQQQPESNPTLSIKAVTKSSVWDIQENDVFRMWEAASKDAEVKENITHYLDIFKSAFFIEDIKEDFGGGWDSLSQSIQDIILSGFDISTTTLPKDRLHKKGGMYEKKVEDGFEVLEVEKGGWVEAIFAKLKPEQEKIRMKFSDDEDDETERDDENEDDEDYEVQDDYSSHDEEDEEVEDPDDDEITEDNYSTMMDLGSEDPDDEAANLIEFVDE